jgi:nucleoid-associated protein Lsr2
MDRIKPMAKMIKIIDDLDGSEPADTVSFGLDHVDYEIDLSEENIRKLWEIFAPYKAAARKARNW